MYKLKLQLLPIQFNSRPIKNIIFMQQEGIVTLNCTVVVLDTYL